MTLQAKFIAAICALAIAFSSGWLVRGWKEAEIKLQLEQANAEAMRRNAEDIAFLQKEKAENEKRIDDLAADLSVTRLRLPKCKAPASGGSAHQTAGTGEPSAAAQEALDRFKRGVDAIALDADRVVEDCRVVMEWAKK